MKRIGRDSIRLTLALLIFGCSTALAAPIVVGLSDEVHFDYGGAANDFHVEGTIRSMSGTVPVVTDIVISGDLVTGNWYCANHTLTQIGPDTWQFTVDFVTDGTISLCQSIQFGIEFIVESHNLVLDLTGWWTLDGAPLDEVAVTGFWVDDLDLIRLGHQTLRIANDTSLDLDILELEVAISDGQIPLSDLSATGLGRPGAPSPLYPGLTWIPITGFPGALPSGSSFDVHLEDFGAETLPGQFLLIRGQQLMTGAPMGDWGTFWEQHESNPAPEPTVSPTVTPTGTPMTPTGTPTGGVVVPSTAPGGLILLLGLVSVILLRRRR